MHSKWNVNYSLSRKFKALQLNLFDLLGSKINMMGGLVQAPVQARSHYIFTISTFKSPIPAAPTTAHGTISWTYSHQHITQTRLLHKSDCSFQKIQAQQMKKGFAYCDSELYHLKYITWVWGVRIHLVNSQDTLQRHGHHFPARMAEKRLKYRFSDF